MLQVALGAGSVCGDLPREALRIAAALAPLFLLPLLPAAIAAVQSGFGANIATASASGEAFGAMTRCLVAAGVSKDIPNAVFADDHCWQYVPLVLGRARSYAAAGVVPTLAPEPDEAAPSEVAS